MNNIQKIFISVLSLVLGVGTTSAQSPKQEWRAVWFTTVWAIDWPNNGYTEAQEKQSFDKYLDQFEKLKLNSVCFQVRSMCDAMYDSQYEPYSKWLTGTRGEAHSYDPLAYLIEKAHARGMEVHAWINPYRFASTSTYTTNEDDYSVTHPEWVQYCDAADIYIINPGEPAVRKRICDVIADIMDHYDVDGFLFDDYFYQSGYLNSYDDSLYLANNPQGLSRADWRRHQVNLMVQDVYNTIKSRKPWCRFGIGPAGVAASSASVAAKYGISPCPDGSDWQYNGIYSEPIQWYVDRSIDYMAPQVYWPIGSSGNDYGKITPWWYEVANHFGRHCYISHSLSGLQTTTLGKPKSTAKQSDFDAYEVVREIQLNQASTMEDAPGTTFYSARKFKETNFINCLKREVWTHKAKVPALTWFAAPAQGVVDNMALNNHTLTWTYSADTVRYGIYAIPKAHRQDKNILSSSTWYYGLSYAKSFTFPDSISAATHDIAVTVVDRYAHEWAPRFLGEAKAATQTPSLLFPTNYQEIMLPNRLKWQPVPGATGYMVQVSKDPTMATVLVQASTDTCTFATKPFVDLSAMDTYYWRVYPLIANGAGQWSMIREFTGHPFAMYTPIDGDTVSHMAECSWEDAGDDAEYVLQIATASTFRAGEIVYVDTTSSTSLTVPNNVLSYNRTYYARVLTDNGNIISTTTHFTTEMVEFQVPELIAPTHGSVLAYPTIHLVAEDIVNNGFKFEISTDSKFPTRGGVTKRKSTTIGVREVDFEDMADGVYYAHVSQAGFNKYGTTIQFTYTHTTGVEDVHVLNDNTPRKLMTAHGLLIMREGVLYDLSGKVVSLPEK